MLFALYCPLVPPVSSNKLYVSLLSHGYFYLFVDSELFKLSVLLSMYPSTVFHAVSKLFPYYIKELLITLITQKLPLPTSFSFSISYSTSFLLYIFLFQFLTMLHSASTTLFINYLYNSSSCFLNTCINI